MPSRRQFIASSLAFAATVSDVRQAHAQSVPAGYPAGYKDIVENARKEGAVAIYTSTDDVQGRPLVEGFKAAFPGIRVDYNDLGTNGAYNRVISEAAAKQVGSDIVWTSAMDLQMTLVSKGYAEAYPTAEAAALPAWANYKDTLYATSVEPIAILYNKTSLGSLTPPKTRGELIAFLKANKDALKGKVASFDPEKSGSGFLFFTNDVRTSSNTWDLVKAFGQTDAKVYGSSGAMREKVASGEHWLAFNVIGSYALEWSKKNQNLGVVLPPDTCAGFLARREHFEERAASERRQAVPGLHALESGPDRARRKRRAVSAGRRHRRAEPDAAERDGRRQSPADPGGRGVARGRRAEGAGPVLPALETGAARLKRLGNRACPSHRTRRCSGPGSSWPCSRWSPLRRS